MSRCTGKLYCRGMSLLKARAWLDLTERKEQGDAVDSRDIRKHKNDVFRLYRVVSPDTRVELPKQVGVDMSRFLSAMETEHTDLKASAIGVTPLNR